MVAVFKQLFLPMCMAVALFVTPQLSPAQSLPGELRGVKRVFIDTRVANAYGRNNRDFEIHEQIAKKLRAKLPSVEIVDRPEEADVHLQFKIKGQEPEGINGEPEYKSTPGVIIPVLKQSIGIGGGESLVCEGVVVRYTGEKGDGVLVLMSEEYWMHSPFDRKPWEKFARDFIKIYQKAN